MSDNLQPVKDKLNSLHDRMPEGEYKQEIVAILQELNKATGVTGEQTDDEAARTGIKTPKSNKAKNES